MLSASPLHEENRANCSVFEQALHHYVYSLPEKKHKSDIIAICLTSSHPKTPEAIHESIKRAEEKHASKHAKRPISRILDPVVTVLRDYDNLVNALASADPMPTAIIWGALGVVVNGIDRYHTLFETIKMELRSLTYHLQRITDYEELYGESTVLQNLLFQTFVNILRFWSRVDKECKRSVTRQIIHAVVSFSTKKLNDIINDMKESVEQIEKLAPIIEARISRGERENAETERRLAGIERAEAKKERLEAKAWREEQKVDLQYEHYRHICTWFGIHNANELNVSRHRSNLDRYTPGTCAWLFNHENYQKWYESASKPSILWVHAPPGSGKSILCSQVIRNIGEGNPNSAIAYHFYQFDQNRTSFETLRLLAEQLFEAFWSKVDTIPQDLFSKTQRKCSADGLKDFVTELVKLHEKVFLILDGLDEIFDSRRWTEESNVIDFLISLGKDNPGTVYIWCSSQNRRLISEKFSSYTVFDIKREVKDDVTFYLSQAVPEIDLLENSEQKLFTDNLQGRADGNFLWASLIIDCLRKEASSPAEMKQYLEDVLPSDLDAYYRKIFDRFEKNQRFLVSRIFSLIAFARRPLRIKELREALGLLRSKNPKSLNRADIPYIQHLLKLFEPLIEVRDCSDTIEDCHCRLFHSTVKDFLIKNPRVISDLDGNDESIDLLISPDIIATTCLRYLAQSRYSSLLIRKGVEWLDKAGQSVDEHHLLGYSAKYWDKHLDVISDSARDELFSQVVMFITSSNFQTCIQVQSLWIDAQFQVFTYTNQTDNETYLRRVFPIWLSMGSKEGHVLWIAYRQFLHEWKKFLSCGNCDDPKCVIKPYAGELDRCWWSALGSQNFLSRVNGRYTSFRFQASDLFLIKGKHLQCYEGVNELGTEVKVLRLFDENIDSLRFKCEHWILSGAHLPILRRKQDIDLQKSSCDWSLFQQGKKSLDNKDYIGQAPIAAFSSDCKVLRIGSRLYSLNSEDEFDPVVNLSSTYAKNSSLGYFEEFSSRGQYVVVATRRRIIVEDLEIAEKKDPEMKQDTEKSDSSVSDSEYPIEGDESSEYETETDSASDMAYESWSDCSSERSEDCLFEDDLVSPWAGPQIGADESSESSEEGNQSSSTESDSSATSDDGPKVVGFGMFHDDDADFIWSDDDGENDSDSLYCVPCCRSEKYRTLLQASISVFDTSIDAAGRVFYYTQPLSTLIYDSPPVIHPIAPLVVWPLSNGLVLFANFANGSYFLRRLRPSTSYTRHIFMKCHFSPCGSFLHIAALEGQCKPNAHSKKDDKNKSVKLALLTSTYRLCMKKTNRSPPTLIHRSRVELGFVERISVSRLPYTLTWTQNFLFLTYNSYIFRTYRIRLFSQGSKQVSELESEKGFCNSQISLPRKTIILPSTADTRAVYFFPETEGVPSRILISGEIFEDEYRCEEDSTTNSTSGDKENRALTSDKQHFVVGLQDLQPAPIGCFISEQTDLAGWINSDDQTNIPGDLGIGKLDCLLERFNPEDDCDLELYIF